MPNARRSTVRSLNLWNRTLHRWGSIAIALPLLLVIATGLLLQVKKQVTWVQPPTARGSEVVPTIGFDQILAAAASVDEAGIANWDDVDRLDVRPSKGVVKVRGKSRWEVQVDASTAEVVQVAYRRSDLIESLHDGSFFGDVAKLWIFLPSAIVLLGLWLTGLYLWALPIVMKRKGRAKRAHAAAAKTTGV